MFVVNAVNNTVGATVGAMGQSVKQLRKTFAGSDLLEGGDVSLEDVILYTAVDKAHLTIKCTPAKNLSCTSALAVRQGPLLKKNEQGQWHTVTACLVPHWFLYYYDDDKEDSPKGIIDMHLYTNTHIDDYPKEKSIWKNKNGDGKTQHVLTLKVDEINARDRRGNPATNSNLKPYYFGSEDKAELLNWTQCINRDRYNVVRDERDAYQSLQQSFSGEMLGVMTAMKTQEAEQSEIATKAAVSQLALVECREAMQQVLVALGADTDTTFLTEISGREFSERARKAINGMRESHEKDTKDTKAAHQSAIDEFSDRVTQLEQQLQQERHNHEHAMEALSAQLTAEIRVSQESLRQAQDIAEQMNSELAVSTANTRAADERCAALGDVKKALVKECKAQRRRLEELEAEAASRAAEKESLMIAVQSLTRQKEALLQRVASYDAQLSSNPSTFISTSTETNANASGNVDLLGLSPTPSNQALTDDSSSADLSEALQIIARARAAGASTEASSASGLSSRLSSRKEKDEDGEKLSADAEGRASSLDLPASPSSTDEGWLTTASRPQKSDSTRTSATFGRDFLGRAMEVFSSAGSATPPAPSTAQAPLTTEGEQLVPKASPRSSMDILHSLLTYEPSKGVNKPMLTSPLVGAEDEVQATREVTPPGAATGNNLSGKSTEFSSTDVNANSLNSPSNVLRCFRCNGTLEGPKHSTCRCKEPQLEKETGFASVFSSFSWGRKG